MADDIFVLQNTNMEARYSYETVTPAVIAEEARVLFRKNTGRPNKTDNTLDKEIQKSLLGTTYNVCSEMWNLIKPLDQEDMSLAQPKHLFWGLLLLSVYCTEAILTRVAGGVDNKTFRKWAWRFIDCISSLKTEVVGFTAGLLTYHDVSFSPSSYKIVLGYRFRNWDGVSVCLMSVDCTDCPIEEPYPFNEGIFSQKLNGPGYKYEVGVCIATGAIVWINGPFRAGRSDVTIFNEDGLRGALAPGECVEVDAGYQGDDLMKNPSVGLTSKHRIQKSRVRARHENVNCWLKKFAVLDNVFRHKSMEKHQICFEACAVITQLRFEIHGGLYEVEYDVEYM